MTTTGPSPQPTAGIAALQRRLAAAQAAISRLQISRTTAPLGMGDLTNMDQSMNGVGLANGSIPVYDAPSGTYKPGVGGTSYPTLAYGALNYLTQSGPFAVVPTTSFPAGTSVFTAAAIFSSSEGSVQVSNGGSTYCIGRLGEHYFPGAITRITMQLGFAPFISDSLTINCPHVWPFPAGGVVASVTSGLLLNDGQVGLLPLVDNFGYSSGLISFIFTLRVCSLDGLDWIVANNGISPLSLGPLGTHQMTATDLPSVQQAGTDLSLVGTSIQSFSAKPCVVSLTVAPSGENSIVP